jgi:hypothetical protein
VIFACTLYAFPFIKNGKQEEDRPQFGNKLGKISDPGFCFHLTLVIPTTHCSLHWEWQDKYTLCTSCILHRESSKRRQWFAGKIAAEREL